MVVNLIFYEKNFKKLKMVPITFVYATVADVLMSSFLENTTIQNDFDFVKDFFFVHKVS